MLSSSQVIPQDILLWTHPNVVVDVVNVGAHINPIYEGMTTGGF